MANQDEYDLYCFLALEQKNQSASSVPNDVECGCKQFLHQQDLALHAVTQENDETPVSPI